MSVERSATGIQLLLSWKCASEMSHAGATLLPVIDLKWQCVHAEDRFWNNRFNAAFCPVTYCSCAVWVCKMWIFIPILLKFRINAADLSVWSYKETCQRRCEGGYSHAVTLTHMQMRTQRYFLSVKATVTHHAPTGGGASRWLPQGWQADDSTHSEAAARDRLQKLEKSCLLTTNTKCGFRKYSALIYVIWTPMFAHQSTILHYLMLRLSQLHEWEPSGNSLSQLTIEQLYSGSHTFDWCASAEALSITQLSTKLIFYNDKIEMCALEFSRSYLSFTKVFRSFGETVTYFSSLLICLHKTEDAGTGEPPGWLSQHQSGSFFFGSPIAVCQMA